MQKDKIYFPNLNGLRFIAAFLVILHHIEQFKYLCKIDGYWGIVPFIGIIGKLGVVLFFVLSGFLITYLLLAEEGKFRKISIKKFYIRRMLRIWPLYILIVVLALFVIPHIEILSVPGFGKDVIYADLMVKLALYTLFLPNVVLALYGVIPFASHTWSIGTEEQFYLIWPWVLRFFRKHRLKLMVFIIFFDIAFGVILTSYYPVYLPYKRILVAFWSSFNIGCMAIGGIYAIILFRNSRFLTVLLNNRLFYATILFVILSMLMGFRLPHLHFEFNSVLFGIIILNFAANDKLPITMENKLFNYLGKISYGLYMYHPIGIVGAIAVVSAAGLKTNWVFYPVCFGFTIILAAISYQYFESYFLKFKEGFSRIKSGNQPIKNVTE